MKRYICIFLVVTGATLTQGKGREGKGSWSISNNSLNVIINAPGK